MTEPTSRDCQDRLAVSPAEAARLAGVGRTLLYEALSSGALRSSKIGKRRVILVDALRAWLELHAWNVTHQSTSPVGNQVDRSVRRHQAAQGLRGEGR
jgi:excisionase family DNA binding protein